MIPDRVEDAVRWRQAREIFDDLVDLDSDDRAARLSAACGDDTELRREVESLLGHDRVSNITLERLVADAALQVDAEQTTMRPELVPPVIGRYRILRKLG